MGLDFGMTAVTAIVQSSPLQLDGSGYRETESSELQTPFLRVAKKTHFCSVFEGGWSCS